MGDPVTEQQGRVPPNTEDDTPGPAAPEVTLSAADVERIADRVVQKLYESKLVRRPRGAANENGERSANLRISPERRAEIAAAIRARRRKQGVIY